jgi:hypothetical protein
VVIQRMRRWKSFGSGHSLLLLHFCFTSFNWPADADIVDLQVNRNFFHHITMLNIRLIDQFITICTLTRTFKNISSRFLCDSNLCCLGISLNYRPQCPSRCSSLGDCSKISTSPPLLQCRGLRACIRMGYYLKYCYGEKADPWNGR